MDKLSTWELKRFIDVLNCKSLANNSEAIELLNRFKKALEHKTKGKNNNGNNTNIREPV